MTKSIKQRTLVKISCLFLFAGCASNPPTETSTYPATSSYPQTTKTPAAKPNTAYKPYYQNTPSYSYDSNNDTGIGGSYSNSFAVNNFIRHMVEKHGFSQSYLEGLFAQAEKLNSVIKLEGPAPSNSGPPRPGSWTRYRNKFLTDQHISNGVSFWRENASAISRASSAYGVDPEYIVGIIGVETYFGKNIGSTKVFDALATLSFHTYRRAKYFQSELENYLLMTREEGFEPRQPVGSWAGAMGLGQFMPSSFRKLAVDFDHNGRRNIWDPHDAIGSVAHYFSKSGWHFNSPVAEPAGMSSGGSVISLSTYEGKEFWQVYPNFKVIKRYNNSDKYAMAVHQLAQAIKQRYMMYSKL